MRDAVLGCHVFKSIGCDISSMLEAAIAHHDGIIDVKVVVGSERNESSGQMAARFRDLLYCTGLDEQDRRARVKYQAEHCNNPQREMDTVRQTRVEDTRNTVLFIMRLYIVEGTPLKVLANV